MANGIHPHYDFVNKKIKKTYDFLEIGEGIFGLSDEEKDNLNLSNEENQLIKPYFTSEQFNRYYAVDRNNLWIIYTDSKYKNPNSLNNYPNIKRHLDKYQKVITSDNKPYGLHRARKEDFFLGEKIITLRKCVNQPLFSYTNFDCYVSATFNIIKTNRINQKWLTLLLNSKLIEFWLRHKGKMQGNNFQIDKEPILSIPIIVPNNEQYFIDLFNEICKLKQDNQDIGKAENKANILIYKLYGLNIEEIKIIDSTISLDDFQAIQLPLL